MQLAFDPLVREYFLLAHAEHGQVYVVRNVRERRPSNTLAPLLGREPRLNVTDGSVADLDGVHFGLEFNKLDYRRSLCLALLIAKCYVTIAQ